MSGADRALQLLVEQVTEGLDVGSRDELQQLQEADSKLLQEGEALELAAAALELAHTESDEQLPEHLSRQLGAQAEGFYHGLQEAREEHLAPVHPFPRVSAEQNPNAEEVAADPPAHTSTAPVESQPAATSSRLGWLVAAAASALALASWIPNWLQPADTLTDAGAIELPVAVSQAGSADFLRQALLSKEAQGLTQVSWTNTEDPASAAASGDVIWSTERQEGYMRFRGLPVNDPGVYQYQLWIFDAEQDERFPIDGGVFDINSDGEVVIKIDAKLQVVRPVLFAITIEKPGGVVVSSRERLPLLAQI